MKSSFIQSNSYGSTRHLAMNVRYRIILYLSSGQKMVFIAFSAYTAVLFRSNFSWTVFPNFVFSGSKDAKMNNSLVNFSFRTRVIKRVNPSKVGGRVFRAITILPLATTL